MSGDVLLDRDGVLIAERPGYVLAPEQVALLPGAAVAIRRLREAGHRVFVLTNQSPVGRGMISMEMLERIHERVNDLVRVEGGDIDGWFICPHLPDAGCDCRKPAIGLLVAARDQAGVRLADAVLVGDQWSDVVAARTAGCRPLLVLSGQTHIAPDGCESVADLQAAADLILSPSRR